MKLNQPIYQKPSRMFWVLLILLIIFMLSSIINKLPAQPALLAAPVIASEDGLWDIYQGCEVTELSTCQELRFFYWNTLDWGFLEVGDTIRVKEVTNIDIWLVNPQGNKLLIVKDREFSRSKGTKMFKPGVQVRDAPIKIKQ